MPDGRDTFTVRVIDRIADIPEAEWNACAEGCGAPYNPFVGHRFLRALEDSGSVSAKSGWQPHHLVMEDTEGRLLAAAAVYVKNHSYGEYVFDHSWAHAYERAGGRYYPKLQCSVPFSPVPGPRLLVRSDTARTEEEAAALRRAFAGALAEVAQRSGVSSLHVTFCTAEDAAALEAAGFLIRHDHQFHWHNRGYGSFDDFLGHLQSRKRKSIRRERRAVAEAGITVRALSGEEIEPRHWDAFHRFYIDTYDRKWGHPYLTRDFFGRVQERLADRVVLVLAEIDGHPIAGALNLRGGDALFGRNWGCDLRYKFLHFETCYYSAIDYAITHGIARVEAGTRGPHKLQRGYLPVRTYSAHWVRDRGFRRALDTYLAQERQAESEEIQALAEQSPYRADCEATKR